MDLQSLDGEKSLVLLALLVRDADLGLLLEQVEHAALGT